MTTKVVKNYASARGSNTLGPPVNNAHSLALRLGVRLKTLWWLVRANKLDSKAQPALYQEMRIAKAGRGFRTLHVPVDPLKALQKSLLVTFFVQRENTPDHVSAYVLGRSTLEAAAQHAGCAVKVSADIKNFFPSTSRRMVRNLLRSEGFSAEIVSIISNLVTVPTQLYNGAVHSVLPQGSPTSAAIANRIAMQSIDDPLLALLPDDAVYTRYCDNLEVSFREDRTREEIDAFLLKLNLVVRNAGYRLNRSKTKIERATSPTRSMQVLGITVNHKPNIPARKYKRLRMLVYQIDKFGLEHAAKTSKLVKESLITHSGGELYSSLHGELIYWNRISPMKIAPLLAKLKEHSP